jgi:Zn-dependent M28 family amino/carboxypeptidase
MRRISAAAGKLQPALVVIVRTGGPGLGMGVGMELGMNPAARLRDASAAASKVPILVVGDPAIRSEVAAMKEATVSAHIAAPAVQPVKLRNVAGVLRGTGPELKDTYVVITGHYDHLGVRGSGEGDHIYNGANDDASGTSSVIEIANALAELAERPRRSIVFMTLFGEEVGLLGSRYYCQHPIFPIARTVAEINLEQLGRTDDTEGPRPLQFNLTGFDYTNIAAAFSAAGEETGIKVVKHEKNSDAFFSRSDNAAFAEVGIPSTTISVSYVFPDYHQPGDEWQKLDYDNMAKVDVAVAVGILKIAASAEAPRWNKDNPKVTRYIKSGNIK